MAGDSGSSESLKVEGFPPRGRKRTRMLKCHVVLCSTRPGRNGEAVARWFYDFAKSHGNFDFELVDLADFALPILDEPNHPRQQKYTKDHTKRWSAKVSEADAFVFVTPEYNFSPPASLVNAFHYLYLEWNYKPCAFVSYGGLSGGMRSVQASKQIATTLKMVPIVEAVALPGVFSQLQDGKFEPAEGNAEAAATTLDELHRWAEALKPMRS